MSTSTSTNLVVVIEIEDTELAWEVLDAATEQDGVVSVHMVSSQAELSIKYLLSEAYPL